MTAFGCWLTYSAQHAGGAIRDSDTFPFAMRLSNGVYAYGMYLWKMVWPEPGTLMPLYPLPDKGGDPISWWLIGMFAYGMVLVTVAAWFLRKKCPYLLVGWLWYLGLLMPANGILVQVGKQAHGRPLHLCAARGHLHHPGLAGRQPSRTLANLGAVGPNSFMAALKLSPRTRCPPGWRPRSAPWPSDWRRSACAAT